MEHLLAAGQEHLFKHWPRAGVEDSIDRKKLKFIGQLMKLDKTIPGGLVDYVERGRGLLKASREQKNPLEGMVPAVPEGVELHAGDADFLEYEREGISSCGDCAFVLVAGGLGERLGYSDIKLAMPYESLTGKCFMDLYAKTIIAYENKGRAGKRINLAIMTSDDTHQRTEELLEEHNYFGLMEDRVTLLKQDKVPCFSDSTGKLALSGEWELATKPHGHGDVHRLLHRSGLAKRWADDGVKWVVFFQDTNPLAFRALPAALAVSQRNDFHMNTMCIPRPAKDSMGAICKMHSQKEGRSYTMNVEYNQLDPLLKASGHTAGDAGDPDTGLSPYPGNTNQFIVALPQYAQILEVTQGDLPEFVNPKYTNGPKSAFKTPARLECMMQDYARILPRSAAVGFTMSEAWFSYSPVKNNATAAAKLAMQGRSDRSATTSEMHVYRCNCKMLRKLGANIPPPEERVFNSIATQVWPRVLWTPTFAATFRELAEKVNGSCLTLSNKATLILEGDRCEIQDLKLDGAMKITGSWGEKITVDGLNVANKGYQLKEAKDYEEREIILLKGFEFMNKLQVKNLGKGKHRSFVKRLSLTPTSPSSPLHFNANNGDGGSPTNPFNGDKFTGDSKDEKRRAASVAF